MDGQKKPKFNEIKTTQAAVAFIQLNGGKMNYMKLIKLLYNLDREALKRWARPVTFDDIFSMPQGQVLSKTLDMIKNLYSFEKTYWDSFIITVGHSVCLNNALDFDELSQVEIDLIREIFTKYKDKDQFEMRDEHHNPELFPEYINPNGSSIKIEYEQILRHLNYSEENILNFTSDMEELAILEELE